MKLESVIDFDKNPTSSPYRMADRACLKNEPTKAYFIIRPKYQRSAHIYVGGLLLTGGQNRSARHPITLASCFLGFQSGQLKTSLFFQKLR